MPEGEDGRIWGACSPDEEERYRVIIRDRLDNFPYYKLLGLQVTGLGCGWATFRMPAGNHLWNVGGIVHGGAITSIAGAAAGVALATLLDKDRERPVTIEIKVNFCAPVTSGVIEAKGEVVQRGNRIAICEVELSDGEGRLVAKGLTTYMVTER